MSYSKVKRNKNENYYWIVNGPKDSLLNSMIYLEISSIPTEDRNCMQGHVIKQHQESGSVTANYRNWQTDTLDKLMLNIQVVLCEKCIANNLQHNISSCLKLKPFRIKRLRYHELLHTNPGFKMWDMSVYVTSVT